MKIIKRSGAEAIFDANKIAQAVKKANDSVVEAERLSHHQIAHIVEKVEKQCLAVNRSLNVEEIQHLVFLSMYLYCIWCLSNSQL